MALPLSFHEHTSATAISSPLDPAGLDLKSTRPPSEESSSSPSDRQNGNVADVEISSVFRELTPEEQILEKELVRKLDWRIMPWVVLVYLMNYIDRNNYAAARLQGLEADLNLTGEEYQVALSILFVGYVLMQVPSNALLNYAGRPSLYLGFFIVAWGLVSALTSQVTSYAGIVVCRFILGIVEAPFFAGTLFYLSKWYTRKELSARMALFYTGSLISGAFGSLIAAGILDGLSGKRGISAWAWLYIIEGCITVAVGIIVAVVLPDFPETWVSLKKNPQMRAVAMKRLEIDALERDIDDGVSQWQGVRMAFADPKTYVLAVMYLSVTGAAGFQNFFPTLTSTLGYSRTISLLLVAPPYVFMAAYSLGHSVLSDRLQNRWVFMLYPVVISCAGFILYTTTESFGPQYAATFLFVFVFAQNGTIYAWIASSIPRPPAKRAAALAFINSVGNSASIWTPFLYGNGDAPHYRVAMCVNIGLEVLVAVCVIILRGMLVKENRRMRASVQEGKNTSGRKYVL